MFMIYYHYFQSKMYHSQVRALQEIFLDDNQTPGSRVPSTSDSDLRQPRQGSQNQGIKGSTSDPKLNISQAFLTPDLRVSIDVNNAGPFKNGSKDICY